MPDTVIAPVIPTVPVTPAVLDALRTIVGEKASSSTSRASSRS